MNSQPVRPLRGLSVAIILGLSGLAQAAGAKLDVAELKAVPDGNYLVTLELEGKQQRLNLKVQGNIVRWVSNHTANSRISQTMLTQPCIPP